MARTGATQQFVQIQDIRDGVVYLKDGGMRRILMVGGVNFELKSEEEQEAILRSFQNLLNGLDFTLQFFIHSRKVNVRPYLEKIQAREKQEQNELLRTQIEEYIEFIKTFVEENPIITKSFFAIVPYNPTAGAEQAKGLLAGILGGPKQKAKEADVERALQQLGHRVDEVTSSLENIGLHVTPLDTQELVELYYNLYNPELTEKQGTEIPYGGANAGEAADAES